VTLADVRGSCVVFYTPPVVVTSLGRIPNEIGALRGRLRDFFWDDIRREELPHLQAAHREVDALYEPSAVRVTTASSYLPRKSPADRTNGGAPTK